MRPRRPGTRGQENPAHLVLERAGDAGVECLGTRPPPVAGHPLLGRHAEGGEHVGASSRVWQGAGVLGPEAFDPDPFVERMPAYDFPFGLQETRRPPRLEDSHAA